MSTPVLLVLAMLGIVTMTHPGMPRWVDVVAGITAGACTYYVGVRIDEARDVRREARR